MKYIRYTLLTLSMFIVAASGQVAAQSNTNAVSSLTNPLVTLEEYTLSPGQTVFEAEGQQCPDSKIMVSGSCNPGGSDKVAIINQWPNISINAWRCGFKNNDSVARRVWTYTYCMDAIASEPPPSLVSHALTVRRYTTTSISNNRVDEILTDANSVSITSDGGGDVACDVELKRDGNVSAFTTGDGSLDSNSELSQVFGLPGWVKVVNQINWCGGPGAGIIGCAPVPGSSMAVVRFSDSLEGILWLHEFLHNKGQGHRNGLNNVMHPSIGETRLHLNTDECDALKATPASSSDDTVLMAASDDQSDAAGMANMSVSELIKQHWAHGLPFNLALGYGGEALPQVLEILNDPTQSEWHVNAAAVAGMIGGEEAVNPLIEFAESSTGQVLSQSEYRAKSTAVMALGYIVNQVKSEKALEYLSKAVDASYWASSANIDNTEVYASIEERNADLATKAVLGLAIAGTDQARAILQNIKSSPQALESLSTSENQSSLIDDAIEENEKIESMGLQEYYQRIDQNYSQ